MSHCSAEWISRDLYVREREDDQCKLWAEQPKVQGTKDECNFGEFNPNQPCMGRIKLRYVEELFGITPPARGQSKRLKQDVQRKKEKTT